MTKYKIKIEPEAVKDIQAATDWYNEQLQGLGSRFQKQVIVKWIFWRAAFCRCRTVRWGTLYDHQEFPFMVDLTADENKKLVDVFAIFHTSRNPKIWEERKE